MMKEIELRLVDAAVPDGEIVVKDLAALTTALQDLITRIGREVIQTPGPGRTRQFMEEFAQLRLRRLEAGSTVLLFSKGPTDKLDIDLPEQELADNRFWDILQAIAEDRRPDWATDLIAESAGKLVDALQSAAPKAALRTPTKTEVQIVSARIHAETWTSKRVQTDTVMTAKGRLEKVDLRSHEFRIRDDVGNAVDLRHVDADAVAGKLVGQWVAATGRALLNGSGRLVALEEAKVQAVDDPAEPYADRTIASVEALLAGAPGPNPAGAIDLDDAELAAFLEAATS